MLKLVSGRSGLIKFQEPSPYSYDWIENGSGKINMRVLIRETFQAELFTLRFDHDDRIHFSDIPWPYTLVFVFGYSVTLSLSQSMKKDIHDRGGHLFHSRNGSCGIRFQKDRNYLIVFIHYSIPFVRKNLEETAQSIRGEWELQSPAFYYSRASITSRDVLELLSMLLIPGTEDLKEDFLAGELARVLLMDFLREPERSFQPAYLGAKHFEAFYKERDDLIALSLKPLPISRLLALAGIRQVPLFRKRLQQLYDLNIREFITENRMSFSVTLLSDPTLSIKEIAGMSGFASPFYFSRVFSHYFGMSPKKFRAK